MKMKQTNEVIVNFKAKLIEITDDAVLKGCTVEEVLQAIQSLEYIFIPSHQKRVIVERDELKIKLDKLITFINSDLFKKLKKYDQHLLCDQNICMAKYLEILNARINNF